MLKSYLAYVCSLLAKKKDISLEKIVSLLGYDALNRLIIHEHISYIRCDDSKRL